MRDRLARIILRTDFIAMSADDPAAGHIALHIASVESRHMADDNVRRHLTEALLGTAGILARRPKDKNSQDLALIFLDCAINIAQCAPPDGAIMNEFARITGGVGWRWGIGRGH